MDLKLTAIIVFVGMYVIMIMFQKLRVYAALLAALIFLAAGVLTPNQAVSAINWNILMMIAGTMIVVDFFIDSKMPQRLADIILVKSNNLMWVIIYMSLFAGLVSAFVDNVATVLMIAPVGLAICRKLDVSPVPMILCIAVSSNLQGAATLVGDTTSIMLGAYANMDFMAFFWKDGNPGIFWAVELGALATVPIMMIMFRRFKQSVHSEEHTEVKSMIPALMLVLVVVTLIAVSFIDNKPENTNGYICLSYALLTLLIDLAKTRDDDNARRALKSIDIETLLLLTGLFVVISGLTEVGVIDDLAELIAGMGRGNVFRMYTIIVWMSVIISAFVDNIPYVATMLPVVKGVTSAMGIPPYLMYFGLLTGATLGGNLTPVGASANITAVGILRRSGEPVTFATFMKIGVPFTLTAVTVGYIFIWFAWS